MNWYKHATVAKDEEQIGEAHCLSYDEVKELGKKALRATKKKMPYYPVIIVNDRDTRPKSLHSVRTEAVSQEQARMFFLDNPVFRDFKNTGFEVAARLDDDEVRRRMAVEQYEKEKEQDVIQNAWWQD